jgi:uncharacterized protein (DUF4213/DUF364 family)
MPPVLEQCRQGLIDFLGPTLPEISVRRAAVGLLFSAVVLDTGHAGAAHTPAADLLEGPGPHRLDRPGDLDGLPAGELIAWAGHDHPLKSALGVAGLNALTALALDRGLPGVRTVEDMDGVDALGLAPGQLVAMIGAFLPFIRTLAKRGHRMVVIERHPHLVPADLKAVFRPPGETAAALGLADAVIISGTTLINQTLDEILDAVAPGKPVVLAGPTASFYPLPLFARGVKGLAGCRVIDPERLLAVVTQAGAGRDVLRGGAKKVVFVPE